MTRQVLSKVAGRQEFKRAVVACMGAAAVLWAASGVGNGLAAQQPLNSIEVLVNDEPISTFDINQRLRLVIAVAGGVRTQEEFERVREQVVQTMVDERLQVQEAAQNELTIQDDQLQSFFERRAQAVGQTPDQFEQSLSSIGASKRTMLDQMNAELAWSQLVQGRMGAFVSVSDEEVEAYIQRLYDNRGKFEYRMAEIVLLVNSPAQEASVRGTAEELVRRIREGSSFPELAQQLSASASAAVGGDLGWITADDLDPLQAEVTVATPIGEVADPIRTPGGYLILAVRDRRRILTADPLDAQLALRQLLLTTEKLEDEAATARFEREIAALNGEETTCDDIAQYVERTGADGRPEIGQLRVRDLQGAARAAVESLPVGQISTMLKMDDGWRALIVCERSDPQVQEPDFDQIYNQIEQQRLSMMARRYLRDLRRDAIVDYR
ncbi:peptidylprolyl isomerase [Eilatimonas milleporae]|uniref:Parvulin-like PPIase n=1 Tax=Eilatimonas milleporae TaxID=911205 RepID=A0A3M0CIK6_9PROT|nr:peptidylprolyl isomerase [Eilatimonas milleporae]RMB08587.1 periplasmic chaperone for outer membrane proteins SurA [Eilatimonas milleporae]